MTQEETRSEPTVLSPGWLWETGAIISAAAAPVFALLTPGTEGGAQLAWGAAAFASAAVGVAIPRYRTYCKDRLAQSDAQDAKRQLAETADEKTKAVQRARNGLSRRFAELFSEYDLMIRRRATAGLEKFAKDVMNQLVEVLDRNEELRVRACYYTQDVMEEDPDFGNDISEVLSWQNSSSGAPDARRDFSTGDDLGKFIIEKMRRGQSLRVVDIDLGGDGIPQEVLDDPRYQNEPRPYTGFYSVPIFDQSEDRKDSLVGMLTVDFDGRGRPTESDAKLVESYKNILTTAVEAAGRMSRAAVTRRVVRLEGRK